MRAMSRRPQTTPLPPAPFRRPGPVSRTHGPSGSLRDGPVFLRWLFGWPDSDWGTPHLPQVDRAAVAYVHQEKSLSLCAPSCTSKPVFDRGAHLPIVGITICHTWRCVKSCLWQGVDGSLADVISPDNPAVGHILCEDRDAGQCGCPGHPCLAHEGARR